MHRSALAALFLFPVITASVDAQCQTSWAPPAATAWATPLVNATTLWDPDGAGPLGPHLVAASSTFAGGPWANEFAMADVATGNWSDLGALPGSIGVLATTANGDLLIASASGSTTVLRRRSGAVSVPIGTFVGAIAAAAEAPNGDLIVAGNFVQVNGVDALNIARWDGTSWSALGTGLYTPAPPPPALPPFHYLSSVVVLQNGDVVAGGTFTLPIGGGQVLRSIARWDGVAWTPMGTHNMIEVRALARMPNGDVVAGGDLIQVGGPNPDEVWRWNGAAWSAMGSCDTSSNVRTFLPLPNGDLIVGGLFVTVGGVTVNNIARWSAGVWSPLAGGVVANGASTVVSLTLLPNGDLVAGGTFGSAGVAGTSHVARWDGAAWHRIGGGMDGDITSLLALPNGDCIGAGSFNLADGVVVNGIGRWNGTTWSPLGSGLGWISPWNATTALHTLSNGDLVVAGNFTAAAGGPANGIARWNGTAWSSLGAGPTFFGDAGTVFAFTRLPNGDLVVGGRFSSIGGIAANGIARWDGTAWFPFGSGTTSPFETVNALLTLPSGDLVAGGGFTTIGGIAANNIARWNGVTWSPLGAGLGSGGARALCLAANGDLIVGGDFYTAGGAPASRVARWNGASWSALGAGIGGYDVRALATLPSGDIVAAGNFSMAGAVTAQRLARWDGGAWSSLGFHDGVPAGYEQINALALRSNGELLVGGSFDRAGGASAPRFARLFTSCPATAIVGNSGCPSSGGANTLAATTLPWVRSTFRATGTGLPATSLVIAATSLTAIPQGVVPLNTLFLEGVVGCDLLVAPDILQLLLTTNGTAQSDLALAPTPSLIGVMFHHQMLPFEFDSQGALVAVTATNSLDLVGGSF